MSLLLERPTDSAELPITLFIDGSGCVSAQREEFQDFARLPDNLIGSTARLIVEKPGVAPGNDGVECSEKVWATRLDAMEYHLLKDFGIPLLIVHGAEDRDSVPVESARELVRRLREDDVAFEYWEVPDMSHGFETLPPERRQTVRHAMLNWLFGLGLGPGGPPQFGRPSQ